MKRENQNNNNLAQLDPSMNDIDNAKIIEYV